MPHVVVQYTANLDPDAQIGALCKALAEIIVAQRDAAGGRVFPIGGTRVLAYPAAHHAVADGSGDPAFAYLHLRMGRGRSEATRQRAGAALLDAARAHFTPLLNSRALGLTLQIDEGPEVFDAKFGNLHAHLAKKTP